MLPPVPADPALRPGAARARRRAADGRLRAARRGFEGSMAALRKAAFDHVESHVFVSTALRASLARLAGRAGAKP
ncbi:hypothetical protein [Methylobacterium planeticum]|uniref:Uncharacterized protein n=1 Tax=Methylobacterium planeticum TaxID=2615211 RepID=A0A6N6MVC7_9HYPH|nr:hypothetical protein [Methylobacterium planeticum]KAB1072838.1 hypothetical protein F6X51_14660 [Methylobacterium planeticum]